MIALASVGKYILCIIVCDYALGIAPIEPLVQPFILIVVGKGAPEPERIAPIPIQCRVAQYALNLDDDVHRDESVPPIVAGNALIHQGTLRSSGIRVAIKITRGAGTWLTATQNTCREAHVWSKLCHVNVLPLLGIATKFDGMISLVAEWMPQGNAHDYVQDRSVDPRPLVAFGHRACLSYLHNHQPESIFHGDVKGASVLISKGHAILTDFGLSFLPNSSFSMAADAPCGGSLPWLSPESIDSQTYDITRPGDIWAFGMTTLELFTRENPFPGIKTVRGLLLRILQGPPERPSDESTCSRMTQEWWSVCCLAGKRNPCHARLCLKS
ncbi:hypothetical protein ID866_11097 [Astraeus odoratus]|nr:hypothetical protein ID866_11097 [Astraeus odoratus]